MSTAALSLPATPQRAVNPWLVAGAVVIPTFMEVLDTTIANVALRYIAGGLSAAVVDSEWVITSYLAANAVILPISGWISARMGRRNYFMLSITVFTIASMLCGLATSLPELILFRVIQGLAGGGLQPSSQAILIDSFPPERQGGAMTVFGLAALVGPVVGPTLGGYLTDNYNWRWIFYINVPVGLLALGACAATVRDPEYLRQQRSELLKKPLNFDYIGFGLLALGMSCWETFLSKGQQWDWLGDPFWRVQTLLALIIFCFGFFIFREQRIKNPVVNFRPLKERNFLMSCIIIFCAYGVLYAASISLPGLLQSLFNYDAYHSGLVMSPAGLFAIWVLLIGGVLLRFGADARYLIVIGLIVVGAADLWMSYMNLQISPWQVAGPRIVMVMGLSLIFAPLNVAAYMYMPRELRAAAVGLFSLLRNEGGSVGTSIAQTLQERREQFHLLRLNEQLDLFNQNVRTFASGMQNYFFQHTGDAPLSREMTWQALANIRQQQASSLAFFDVFWVAAVVAFALVLLVPLMKRSVAEKGAHVAAD
ncbi:MAG TPA: DHA2 family efflux MFS transporter permease subunit [Pirellulales bacterium]|jgi:DHA2 family multidrug resistance protein|nr:DHA2 family efflux MFS transporter permease subunit [Pirellulales bacterium]